MVAKPHISVALAALLSASTPVENAVSADVNLVMSAALLLEDIHAVASVNHALLQRAV